MKLDSTKDRFLSPLLALLQDAINSDLEEEGLDAGQAVQHVAPYDMPLELAGELSLPALSCFRMRTALRRHSAIHLDELVTLRFRYITPGTARESLDERWPLIEHAWRSLVRTLEHGYHSAHRDGVRVRDEIGIVWIAWEQTNKVEMYADSGEFAYPAFQADVVMQVRDLRLPRNDTTELHPMAGLRAEIGVDGGTADVTVEALTPVGEAQKDAEPFEEEAVLP